MADNLPLIPNKYGGCAGDVRPVLRAVFRERATRLPPLPPAPAPACDAGREERERGDTGASASALLEREELLRAQRACGLARPPPPHPFTLHEPRNARPPTPPDQHTLLQRSDLMPRIDQNAIRETLWIKNILNRSSGDISTFEVTGARLKPPMEMSPAVSECRSAQSLSIGEVAARAHPRPPPPPPPPPSQPQQYITCIPTSINFVNFTPRQLHTLPLRLVNVSQEEVQLSVRPPRRRELDLQLCGRLKVTAGSSTELLVMFTPPNVCSVYDELLVRVSFGQHITVPISCYIEAPTLDVVMPNMTMSLVSCAIDVEGAPSFVSPESALEVEVEVESRSARGAGDGAGAELLDLGARLLGDVHHAGLVLRCALDHVSFFILTEDAWFSRNLSEVSETGALVAGAFAVAPAWWRGGGEVRGGVWCRARAAGLHAAALRLLCSTAVVRPLHLLADALFFYPEHIRLKAQEKDYDICSDDDPDCEYYVNLGTTFQHHSLAASILILNHSPLTYSYYWSVRAWGKCSCWQERLALGASLSAEGESARLCPGARGAREAGAGAGRARGGGEEEAAAAAVRVEPAQGAVAPRVTVPVRISVPDVGERLGTQRAVLILVLRNIPEKSFPQGFYPMIVSTSTVKTEHIPGFKREDRVYCDVVCCQLEVWWRVTPLRFVLDPPFIELPYSRRVQSIELQVRATQLFGGGSARARWHASRAGAALPPALSLRAARPQLLALSLPLTELPNSYPLTETITLEEERGRWSASARVARWCETRHPALRPVCTWLGVVPPRQHMKTHLKLINDTFQNIYWWGDVYRWLNEQWPKEVCQSRPQPCPECLEECCTCRMLQPSRGALKQAHSAVLEYDVNAPNLDGCVATLVRVRRTEPGTARPAPAPPHCARAALVAYRVLAARLTLTVRHCTGATTDCSGGCCLDEGALGAGALLRPARALVAGLRSCYRLRFTNLTPIRTTIKWDPEPDDERLLRAIFIPNEFDVDGYEEVDIRVVLEARRVCARRVWARRAQVLHAAEPLYLLIDAAISGLEVDYWLPLPDYSFCLRRKQREMFLWDKPLPTTVQEAFAWEDAKRAVIEQNICQCAPVIRWVSPPPSPPRPPGVATPPIKVVTSPPPMTRTCACFACARPLRPAPDPLALEVRALPLHTVHTLRVRMRSVCPLAARWSARARLGALTPPRVALTGDRWAGSVRASGVAARVSPARGVLGARATQDIELRVYADTWGLYQDQILILVEGLEPLVLNLWVEAMGCPLQFALKPGPCLGPAPGPCPEPSTGPYTDNTPVLWVSESDPAHVVHARNTSRAPLLLHAYLLREHEHVQDPYPFRLCIRFFDVLPPVCPCLHAYNQSMLSIPGEEMDLPSVSSETMDTGFEVFLAPDYGIQDSSFFKVEPVEQEVCAGGAAQWAVTTLGPASTPPAHTLLIRMQPLAPQGPWWFRGEPAPAAVRVRGAARGGALQLSHDALVAHLSALALPAHEVMRVRKRLCVQNVGDGRLLITVRVRKDESMVVIPSTLLDAEEPGERDEGKAGGSFMRPSSGQQLWAGADTGTASQAGELYRPSQVEDMQESSLQGSGPEWSIVRGERRGACAGPCGARQRVPREDEIDLTLPAHSTAEICVEVSVRGEGVSPPAWEGPRGEGGEADEAPPVYEQDRTFTSYLEFYDDLNVLKSVPLVLQLSVPRVLALPHLLELGYVCDGDTRKTYFTVSHTSRTDTLSLSVRWVGGGGGGGGAEFRVHPTCLLLPPAAKQNVYVIYSGRFPGAAVSEGWAVVRAAGAAGAWCCAAVRVRALASRDFKCHLAPHDHTDDPVLLPPDLALRDLP